MTNKTKPDSYQDVCPTKCEGNTDTDTNTDKGDDNHNGNISINLNKFAHGIIQEAEKIKNPTDKQCKKTKNKKKKKKLSAYKQFLKSVRQSRYTDAEKQQMEHDKIKGSTGGGRFRKHDSI